MNSKELKAEAEKLDRAASVVPVVGEDWASMYKECYSLQFKAYRRMWEAYIRLESEKKEVI